MIRAIQCAAAFGLVVVLTRPAFADPVDDFLDISRRMADVAIANKADCTGQAAKIDAFLKENGAALRALGPKLKGAEGTKAQQETMEVVMNDYEKATKECPEAGLMILGLVEPIEPIEPIEEAERELNTDDPMKFGPELIMMVGGGALTYYQEEHVSEGPLSASDGGYRHSDGYWVSTQLYPEATSKTCDVSHQVWEQTRSKNAVEAAIKLGFEVCYQSSADQQSFAMSITMPNQPSGCLMGTANAGDPRIDVDGIEAEACMATLSKVEEVENVEKYEKSPTIPTVDETKPEPTVADVEAMCEAWGATVKEYGKDCPVLGKRLQRQFRALNFTLADVPRIGDHRRALVPCKDAVKAMASCASDKEVKAAQKVLGEL